MTRRPLALAVALWVFSPSGIASAQNSCESAFCDNVRRLVGHASLAWRDLREWNAKANAWEPTFDLLDKSTRYRDCWFTPKGRAGESTVSPELPKYVCEEFNSGLEKTAARETWNRLNLQLRAALVPENGWEARVDSDVGLRLTLSQVDFATVKLLMLMNPDGKKANILLEILPSPQLRFGKATEEYDKGEEAFKQKDYGFAFWRYSAAIDIANENLYSVFERYREPFAHAYYQRAWIHNEERRYHNAIVDLEKSIELNPKNGGAHLERAYAYWRIAEDGARMYEAAVVDYTEAIRLDPKSSAGFENRASIYRKLGKFDLAIADASQSLALNPASVGALLTRATSHFNLRDYASALRDYTGAAKLDVKSPKALYGRGVAKRLTGDLSGGDADIAAAKLLKADIAQIMAKEGVMPPN